MGPSSQFPIFEMAPVYVKAGGVGGLFSKPVKAGLSPGQKRDDRSMDVF